MLRERSAPERGRVADLAFGRLRTAIFERELQAGERLSGPGLGEQLRVSRSPVREAVQRLVREGLAEEVPHRGAAVVAYGARELADVYEIREVLEGLAARLAAEHADNTLVEELAEIHEQHREAVERGDQSAHVALDTRFHALTREGADNAWLSELLDQIRGKIQLAMLSTSVGGGREQALAEHGEILRAIQQRDPDAAERAARTHIARLRRLLRARAEAGEGAAAGDGAASPIR